MTDTGEIPGEGLPANAGGQPGAPRPADARATADVAPGNPPGQAGRQTAVAYSFDTDEHEDHPDHMDQGEHGEDDDLLLMPGAGAVGGCAWW
ncbi:hypothetical protein H8N00_29410 [Streptomyces sp. AC563]|uniref:hypothetical protein n=1 Tax=Streptomyces buecherae TaxID=2763006 RepID=UPI00164ED9BD|nr:hypothetical protein [Streptomyces buecherae]MBC3992918.1 hypothetical protein [Streptomyces buecherae]